MTLLSKSAYLFGSAWDGLRRAPFLHLVSVTTIALALLLGGMSRMATRWLDTLVAASRDQLELTVYLEGSLSEGRAGEIAKELSKLGASARIVSSQSALSRLRAELGELGAVLEDLPRNPLPVTIELDLPSPVATPGKLADLVRRAKAVPGVAEVDDGGRAMSQLLAVAQALRFGATAVFATVAFATVLIVAATLQLAIYARRDEIEIQRLVGASSYFVRAPFLIEGFLEGLAGALAAAAGLIAIAQVMRGKLAPLMSFVAEGRPRVSLPLRPLLIELIVAGCLLGLIGSLTAVRRFSRS